MNGELEATVWVRFNLPSFYPIALYLTAPNPHPLLHHFDPTNLLPPPISIHFYVYRKLGILHFPTLMALFTLASLVRNQNSQMRSPFNVAHTLLPVVQVSIRTYAASYYTWPAHAE